MGLIYNIVSHLFPREIKKLLELFEYPGTVLKMYAGARENLNFQGQVCQDLIAYLYFKNKKDGFYVDIGANDGVTGSNTLVFEEVGWTGICVEPQPDIFEALKKNRKCDCVNAAISDTSNMNVKFIKASGEAPNGLSGLASKMSGAHKRRIRRENGKIEYITVKTISFEDLMKNHNVITRIDFMSIDVEGAELDILKTIDFNKYSFGLITVENNAGGDVLERFMNTKGYKLFIDAGNVDLMFVPA
jgi:FkbM family methyltransferase